MNCSVILATGVTLESDPYRTATLDELCEQLATQGLHVVTAADKVELEQYRRFRDPLRENIEVLTDGERFNAQFDGHSKAIRIDALTAALAESRAECERLRADVEHMTRRFLDTNGRALTAERKLAAAEAECERLRGESATRLAYSEQWRTEALSLRARLAAAEALLRRVGTMDNPDDEEVSAFLASAKPAAPAPRGVHVAHEARQLAIDAFRSEQARTEAEQRVLSAVAAASDDIVRQWVAMPAGLVGFYYDLGVAELARRGLKP
jgi:hypothetical protein